MDTEKQARELWCPMARFAIWSKHGNSAAANRLGDDGGVKINHEYCRCIASQCAMWRWLDPSSTIADRRTGYCGLAGKPATTSDMLAALQRIVNDSMFKDHPEASQMAIDAIAKATGSQP